MAPKFSESEGQSNPSKDGWNLIMDNMEKGFDCY